jgi:hypothetical protein
VGVAAGRQAASPARVRMMRESVRMRVSCFIG